MSDEGSQNNTFNVSTLLKNLGLIPPNEPKGNKESLDDAKKEIRDIEHINHDFYNEQIRLIRLLTKQKEDFGKKGYTLVKDWLIFVAVMIVANGIFTAAGGKFISDGVIISLIGGATASIVGLFAIILRSTFSPKLYENIVKEWKINSNKHD